MVQGQEERKNKAKLEKTQASLTHSNAEYQTAIKALEETTERWNREWKHACDVWPHTLILKSEHNTESVLQVFQDLEEERIDTLKSSLWSLCNIASEVCVSDDAVCSPLPSIRC